MIGRLISWRGLFFVGVAVFGGVVVVFGIIAMPILLPPKGYGKDLPPARLLEDFHSYSTVETVRGQVRRLGLQWHVIKEPTSPPSATHPLYIAKVPNFSHLGVTGDLSFIFFRDRLMRIQFVPPDPRAYWNALVRAEQLREVRSHINDQILWAKLGEDVQVWLNTTWDTPFVGWRDERLTAEVNYRFD